MYKSFQVNEDTSVLFLKAVMTASQVVILVWSSEDWEKLQACLMLVEQEDKLV